MTPSNFFILATLGLAQSTFADTKWSLTSPEQREALEYRNERIKTDGPIGLVEKLVGVPRVERLDKEGRLMKPKLGIAAQVFEKDRFVTDKKTKVHVRCIDKNYLEIGPDTLFQLERLQRGGKKKEETIFRFTSGLVRITAAVVEEWVHFYVKNQDRILAVEGPSDFYLSQDPQSREMTVFVKKGKVFLTSALHGKKMAVPEGQSRKIRSDGVIQKNQLFNEDVWNQLKEQTAIRMPEPDPQATAEAVPGV